MDGRMNANSSRLEWRFSRGSTGTVDHAELRYFNNMRRGREQIWARTLDDGRNNVAKGRTEKGGNRHYIKHFVSNRLSWWTLVDAGGCD